MKTSRIVGYFGSYHAAYDYVGKRFKESRQFSIQPNTNDHRKHKWILIYYGNFI